MSETEGEQGGERTPIARWRTIMLVVVAVLGAAVLVGLIVTVSGTNRERDRALQLQSHSYEVMILTRTLSGTIARAEASLGRYVISTDKQLGRLYFDEWLLAGQEIDRLDQVTGDNDGQQARIDQLRRAYKERGKELSLTALSTNYGKNSQALSRYYQARKARSLSQINALLDGIITHERGLLDSRTGAVLRTVNRANLVVKILAAFGIVIVLGAIALGWMTVQALGARATARAEADAERSRVGQLEAAVAAATAELKQQAIERAETETRLRQVQKMEAVGQLTGGIAHDFNNMLAVVLGGLELAKRNIAGNPKQTKRHIDNAMEGANRAATLTRRLLAFSRAEALLPEPVAAGALIAGMSDLLDRTLGDAITVKAEDDGGDWTIWVDRHQLENALLNLAVNARDAMEGKGALTISTGGTTLAEGAIGQCAGGDYVTIAVADTGCGMAADVLERVFEPFFTTKPVGKGTGLGLSQIFGFVRQSDGEVGIELTPGEGSMVTLYLPRHFAATTAGARDEAIVETVGGVHTGLDILVVEDDPRVLTASMGALEELGHHPIACNDPQAAQDMLRQHDTIDLILSDVLMPGMTGPEMIAALSPAFPHIAVLFVTGYSGEAAGEEFGGHGVLRKPYTLAGLERAIDDVMSAARPAPPNRIAAE